MMIQNPVCAELRSYLKGVNAGDIPPVHQAQVIGYLTQVWEDLPGSDEQSTTSWKLSRAEHLRWEHPNLYLTLERHGRTVNGSSRAELHQWIVNVESGVAVLSKRGIRQLRPMAKRFDAKAASKEIAALILNRREDSRLNWLKETRVQVILSKVAPSANLQTQTGRNKRLRQALTEELSASGWSPLSGVSGLVFGKTEIKSVC